MKRTISLLLVISTLITAFTFTVVAEPTELPTFDNCKDGNGNQLDTHYINDANIWNYEEGKLSLSTSANEGLILFDNELNKNTITADYYTSSLAGSTAKDGIVFAYDENTQSYYWLYILSYSKLCLTKIVNGVEENNTLLDENIYNIPNAENKALGSSNSPIKTTIAVEWDEETGVINASFNGTVYTVEDKNTETGKLKLTGNLYGIRMKDDNGHSHRPYFKSFTAGIPSAATPVDVTATPILPPEVEYSAGTTFNGSVNVNGWNNDNACKGIQMVLEISDGLTVTNVTIGTHFTGGTVKFNQDGTTLRISYMGTDTNADNNNITVSGTASSYELFNIAFEAVEDLEPGDTLEISIVEAKILITSDPDSAIDILDPAIGTDTAEIVQGISFSATELYTGDGSDIIPSDKTAILITVTNPGNGSANTANLIYDDGTYVYVFKYNEAISIKLGIGAYIALVDNSGTYDFTNSANYTFGTESSDIKFGDVNGDGSVNAQDALAVIDMWLRNENAPTGDDAILAANVNGDSKIDTYDALGIIEAFTLNNNEYIIVTKATTP
ncbi:MAG: hypothetical protein E7633_09365 [Ruminococcaceae bacterium]|nr:hypothetical protein [Oscillospiraceae bacterium]